MQELMIKKKQTKQNKKTQQMTIEVAHSGLHTPHRSNDLSLSAQGFFFPFHLQIVSRCLWKSVEYADIFIFFKTLSYIMHSNYLLFNMTLNSATLHPFFH